jgi:hypothetical protein
MAFIMSESIQPRIRREVELIQRFANSYSGRFDEMIRQLNTPAAGQTNIDGQCLRLCVESMNLVLNMQCQLAQALHDLSRGA